MYKYINAAVNMTETEEIPAELISDVISPKTLDNRIMLTDKFNFADSYRLCNTYTVPLNITADDLDKFGATLVGNMYFLPHGLTFSISCTSDKRKSRHPDFILSRNGVSIIAQYPFESLNVTFTPFGYKCYLASLDLNRPFIKVVNDMLVYSQYFDLL